MEKAVSNLESEIKALKNAYEQAALQLPVFTYTNNFRSSLNHMKVIFQDGTEYEFEGVSRIMVTFTSSRGTNTLANLEIDFGDYSEYGVANIHVRRIPYSGGARWIIYENSGEVKDYIFRVHSAVEGTLEAKMIWQ